MESGVPLGGMGCQWFPVIGGRDLLVATLAEGKCWSGRAQRPGWLHGGTEHGLTGHELVGPVPFLLIVMQCPQIDDNICALVDGKLADAAREGKERGVWNIVLLHLRSHLLSPESPPPPLLGKRAFYTLTPTPSSFSLSVSPALRQPLLLTCTYVSTLVCGISVSVRARGYALRAGALCMCCGYWTE